ncbi:MAG: S41 family peptidase [Pirellulales bacterium]|nr:S41 family peptidase [Pirellulales bacterium]
MPRRNLAIIAVTLIVALLCLSKVQTNPYVRILAESMRIVERNALEEVKDKQLFEGAMNGLMGSLDDEYSYYMPPALQKEMNEELDGKFGGIGAQITLDPQTRELVLMPLFDSPASKAGMLPGDKLLRIDDRSTQGMSLRDASELLRGKPGERVKVRVLHPGREKPSDLEIARAEIHVDTVLGDTRDDKGTWSYFLPETDKIAYVRITGFSVETAAELQRALEMLDEQKMKGLIVDLRDNPGGLLPSARDICNLFLKNGDVIVSTRGRDGKIDDEYRASGNGRYADVPLVLLVNGDSASASEIFAACMQDHRRAKIVGQRTHGKGTVQHLIDLERGCGAIRLTTSSYWRPSGENIQRKRGAKDSDQWGVRPDPGCEVAVGDQDRMKLMLWRIRRETPRSEALAENAEDYRTVDRQLDKAVECLQKEIE